jgi:hypothetical protein
VGGERRLATTRHVASAELDPWLSRQRQLLEQIRLCDAILAGPQPQNDGAEHLGATRSHLVALLGQRNHALAAPLNVDPSAPPEERVAQFWTILGSVVGDLDSAASAAVRAIIERFLLHVAWHEGAKLTARAQFGDGPARSFFQLEAHRAKDAADYAQVKGWVGKLATAAGVSDAEITAAAAALPSFDPNDPDASAKFPSPNAIGDALGKNDLFGAYLTRIAFKKVPEAIPETNAEQAAYWYDNWKRSGGDPQQLQQIFKAESDAADQLIPA